MARLVIFTIGLAMALSATTRLGASESAPAFDWEKVLELPPLRTDPGNAWERWEHAGSNMQVFSDAEHEWIDSIMVTGPDAPSADQLERLAEILEGRSEALAAFDVRPGEYVQVPRPHGPEGIVEVGPVRALARLKALDVRRKWMQGDPDAALSAAADIVACGAATIADPGSLIGYLSGVAVCLMGTEACHWIASRDEVSSAHLETLLRVLAETSVDPIAGFKQAARAEYHLVFLVILERLPQTRSLDELLQAISLLGMEDAGASKWQDSFGDFERPLLDVAATRELFGRPLAEYLEALRPVWKGSLWQAPLEKRMAEWQAEIGAVRNLLLMHDGTQRSEETVSLVRSTLEKLENPIGKMHAIILTPMFGRIARTGYVSETRFRLLDLLLAMRLVLERDDAIPDSLEELRSAAGLEETLDLEDPFSGNAFGYDPRRLRVWSVGHDGVDDGGVADHENAMTEPDIVASLPLSLLTIRDGD